MNKIFAKSPPQGLLAVCASGIGESLNIPEGWPSDSEFALTNNCLLFDHRNFASDIYDVVELYVGKSVAADDFKKMQM